MKMRIHLPTYIRLAWNIDPKKDGWMDGWMDGTKYEMHDEELGWQ
eukprot:CAMPEP_0184333606 /NCGR_PEP_ID=MMETSP1089-20130417/2575_1 /TAXON_ID=38269 ORGANISM="Gloeochaete wittrockiana, Strain SAG46.84" /NCGR_SAMPLE_ID=MMETSP1089 /ASSEMBLY_ACC=CAM_ASM_000445 /LENGTH=44 /DNA_ID= /DNA_START= /DNA_END= /DNA_ORIENTATION=